MRERRNCVTNLDRWAELQRRGGRQSNELDGCLVSAVLLTTSRPATGAAPLTARYGRARCQREPRITHMADLDHATIGRISDIHRTLAVHGEFEVESQTRGHRDLRIVAILSQRDKGDLVNSTGRSGRASADWLLFRLLAIAGNLQVVLDREHSRRRIRLNRRNIGIGFVVHDA